MPKVMADGGVETRQIEAIGRGMRGLLLVPAIAMLSLPAAAQQAAPPAPAAAPTVRVNMPDPSASTARERGKVLAFAQCLVRQVRPHVVRLLEEAPGSGDELARAQTLRERGYGCAEEIAAHIDRETRYIARYDIAAGALRGPLAEALYESDFAPSNPRPPADLARIPAVPPLDPAAASDPTPLDRASLQRFARCVVASAPDPAAALLGTAPGAAEELEAIRRTVTDFDHCFASDESSDINIPTLRGFVAEAAYRRRAQLALGEEPEGPTNEEIARRGSVNGSAVVIIPLADGAAVPAEGYNGEDVRTLVAFARCVAERRTPEAEALLQLDYRGDEYNRAARELASRTWRCVPDGRLRFSRLLFAGGVAESRLASLPAGTPLARRIEGAGTVEPRETAEAIGLCLVRNRPQDVTALLATGPASAEELRVIGDLTPHIGRCVAPGQIARIGQPTLRAVVALSAYRLVQSGVQSGVQPNSAAPRQPGN